MSTNIETFQRASQHEADYKSLYASSKDRPSRKIRNLTALGQYVYESF